MLERINQNGEKQDPDIFQFQHVSVSDAMVWGVRDQEVNRIADLAYTKLKGLVIEYPFARITNGNVCLLSRAALCSPEQEIDWQEIALREGYGSLVDVECIPSKSRVKQYMTAESNARNGRRGIWNAGSPATSGAVRRRDKRLETFEAWRKSRLDAILTEIRHSRQRGVVLIPNEYGPVDFLKCVWVYCDSSNSGDLDAIVNHLGICLAKKYVEHNVVAAPNGDGGGSYLVRQIVIRKYGGRDAAFLTIESEQAVLAGLGISVRHWGEGSNAVGSHRDSGNETPVKGEPSTPVCRTSDLERPK